jgi:uncharacterized delta-60 repeat protein
VVLAGYEDDRHSEFGRMPMSVRRESVLTTVVLGTIIAIATAGPASAMPGDLDPSFGTGGKVTASGSLPFAMAMQADGKIVTAGYTGIGSQTVFGLARFTSTGALDPTFGSGGEVATAIGSSYDVANAVAIQSDGRILAVGQSSNGSNADFALVRYTTSGALDPSFGSGGKVTTPVLSSNDIAEAVAVQSDGKIIAAGGAFDGSYYDVALARYTGAGALDPTFGSGGTVVTAIGPRADAAFAVAVRPDGKILIAGVAYKGTNRLDFALVRYTSAGALDPSFGSGGKVTTNFGSGTRDLARAIALQPDGKIVVAGYSANPAVRDFALARYGASGGLDPTFGSNGKVVTATAIGDDQANAVALQTDGKIVAAGSSVQGSGADFAVARYEASGILDGTFGSGGVVITDFTGTDDRAFGMALQPDGKIVAAGTTCCSDTSVARYLP